ncbi:MULTISPECIES: dihydrofolate reductase family protein [unclassified Micromonospora]|uniref:dihydrofolate reductase family protein n=1 Tax=unclassified Micromonospora TaxID=2617518 RepID=UPI003A8A404E
MNVSVDMKIEHAPGENGGGDWMRIGESLHREFNARARALSQMVQGRKVYEIMEAFWPGARDDASLPGFLREYGEIWTSTPKVLVSRTRVDAGHDTRIVGRDGDAVAALAELRARADGDIGVGGATVATQLLRAGLLDEVMMFVHPVVLGTGRALFDDQDAPVELDLLENRAFEQGVTLHRYAVRGARQLA